MDKARKPCNWVHPEFGLDVMSILLRSIRYGLVPLDLEARKPGGMYGRASQEGCMVLNNEEIKVWSVTEDHGARKPRRDVWDVWARKPWRDVWY